MPEWDGDGTGMAVTVATMVTVVTVVSDGRRVAEGSAELVGV